MTFFTRGHIFIIYHKGASLTVLVFFEIQGTRVDAVSFTGGIGAIIKDVS